MELNKPTITEKKQKIVKKVKRKKKQFVHCLFVENIFAKLFRECTEH